MKRIATTALTILAVVVVGPVLLTACLREDGGSTRTNEAQEPGESPVTSAPLAGDNADLMLDIGPLSTSDPERSRYWISATNNGPEPSGDITMRHQLPGYVDFDYYKAGKSNPDIAVDCEWPDGEGWVECKLPGLAPGDKVVVDFDVIPEKSGFEILGEVSAEAPDSKPDNNVDDLTIGAEGSQAPGA